MSNDPLWTPSPDKINNSDLHSFMAKNGHEKSDYHTFWQWSVDNHEDFWNSFWDHAGIIGNKGDVILKSPEKMEGAQFFPEGAINYAENLLQKRGTDNAIIFRPENYNEKNDERALTFDDLQGQVSLWQQAFQSAGLKKGDRVAAYLPNMPETVIACLACASLGIIWSSASPDFGTQGLIDRFSQIEPKIFIAADGYFYSGKEIDCLQNVRDALPQIKSVEKTVIIPFINDAPDLSGLDNAITQNDFLGAFTPQKIEFTPLPFNHPLFIMFSSGTTGKPKCIVHGHGGTLLQHIKEHRLQCDFKDGDALFYFTTCGWMMWNWLISGLSYGATLLLYDGNPFYGKKSNLWDFVDAHDAALFGTSAKYIEAMKKFKVHPAETHKLNKLKVITSTGSPLVHESFDFVYNKIKEDVHLASISGGTDIVSCFMLGNPISPVYRGELQGAGLGLAIDIFDENGAPLPAGAGSGELVCTKPFPCMPIHFWNDEDGAKFHKAYFEEFDNIWCHGDWVERTEHKGYIIHGRSDATLNPGGVRIGTAEIYRQVEKVDAVLESVAVGQNWKDDIRIILFVIMREGHTLTSDVKDEIRVQIKQGATPRHNPARIIEVADIPKTKSGKISELVIRDIIHGRAIKNKEALANPEALKIYETIEI